MKIYNSYQEAKIENPDKAIIRFNRQDEFKAVGDDDLSAYLTTWTKCDPADYCITYNQCNKFMAGMLVMDSIGIAELTKDSAELLNELKFYNANKTNWDRCYILRAAALENKMNIDKVETQTPEESHPDPQHGEVWRCILLPHQYVIYLYKAHNEWDTDWVNSELLEGQKIKPIQKLYTQSDADRYAKKCVDYDRKRFALEKPVQCGYSVEKTLAAIAELDKFNDASNLLKTPLHKAVATEHQEEMSAFSGKVEWNGEGLPPVGVECEIYCPVNPTLPDGDKDWMNTEIVAIIDCGFGAEKTVVYRTEWSAQWYVDAHPSNTLKFRKPETQQQREDRERLEAAYDLCCLYGHNDFESAVDFERYHPELAEKWLLIVDKTNYRKGVK